MILHRRPFKSLIYKKLSQSQETHHRIKYYAFCSPKDNSVFLTQDCLMLIPITYLNESAPEQENQIFYLSKTLDFLQHTAKPPD